MPKRKAIVIGVSLFEKENAIVTRENERRGLFNISAMIRLIINEWAEHQHISITAAGKEALRKPDQLKE
jgi:hypothetical protein